ncbi:MAG: hypothetical protein FJ000_07395 [Actinobacteria bacterium]|nr:hypothetical protein [Actinomycetota bacterium]
MILLGGDYVHSVAERIAPCFAELVRLRAPLGLFAVLGNYDHRASTRLSQKAMARAGIVELDNRGAWIKCARRRHGR